MTSQGLLDRFQNYVKLVPMYGHDIVSLVSPSMLGIGTRDLNSCHGVIILSPAAIIASHISPRANDTTTATDLLAGDRHVRSEMEHVVALYRNHQNLFPSGSTACGVFAWYRDEVALPDQQAIILEQLRLLGLSPESQYYKAPTDRDDPSAGTVIAGWFGNDCKLYVEDREVVSMPVPSHLLPQLQKLRQIARGPQISSSTAAPSSTSSSSTSAASNPTSTVMGDTAENRSDLARAAILVLMQHGKLSKDRAVREFQSSVAKVNEQKQLALQNIYLILAAAKDAIFRIIKCSSDEVDNIIRRYCEEMRLKRQQNAAQENVVNDKDSNDDENDGDHD